ncbi:hypothetical protein L9G16_20220, partial [Shewanella sp. A25]|nr:hypothetical protein [Shewanella shenzhenensis]
ADRGFQPPVGTDCCSDLLDKGVVKLHRSGFPFLVETKKSERDHWSRLYKVDSRTTHFHLDVTILAKPMKITDVRAVQPFAPNSPPDWRTSL